MARSVKPAADSFFIASVNMFMSACLRVWSCVRLSMRESLCAVVVVSVHLPRQVRLVLEFSEVKRPLNKCFSIGVGRKSKDIRSASYTLDHYYYYYYYYYTYVQPWWVV